MSEDERLIHGGEAGVCRTVSSCWASKRPELDLCRAVETRDTGIDDPDAIEKLLIACTNAVEGSAACLDEVRLFSEPVRGGGGAPRPPPGGGGPPLET
ncbi:hypothetical protein ACFV0K_09270, partial [Streptomyces sp. NPDC059586]